MQALTLTIAAIASVLVFFIPPVYGLIVYIAAFAYYPTYLSVPIGTIDFTVRRIVILAIFAKLFLQTDLPGRFRFIWLDKIVIIYFTTQVIAQIFAAETTIPFLAFLENRAGAVCDMVLPYFAVRMILRNKQQYLTLLKGILIIAAPLAIVGFYQCMTDNNPVGFLKKYYAWKVPKEIVTYQPKPRYGFYRANVTFSMPIMYGLFFAMFGPICACFLNKKKKFIYIIGIVLMAVGVFSSMSSGPMLGALLSILFIAFYRWRRYWKIAIVIIIIMCSTLEMISNRHFYDVFGDFALKGSAVWYRSRLIDVALFEGGMSGHWLTGYGLGVDPGWGGKVFYGHRGYEHSDVVNQYLAVLCRFGLIGLAAFLAMNIGAIKRLVGAYKASVLDSDKWLIWCLSAGWFGLAGVFVSVSLFGPPTTIYYMMLGFAGAMPNIIRRGDKTLGVLSNI